jgi:hypothetical protein
MQASFISTDLYAKVIANSKRVRWDIEDDVLRARRFDLSKPYRWRYIVSGVMQPHFQKVVLATLGSGQVERVNDALAPLLSAVPAEPSRVTAMA